MLTRLGYWIGINSGGDDVDKYLELRIGWGLGLKRAIPKVSLFLLYSSLDSIRP